MSDKLVAWAQRVRQFDVASPVSRGALWSGLGATAARQIGVARGLTTLESTAGGASLDRGEGKRQLDADFGPAWGPQKKQVWTWLSLRFARALSGQVTLLLRSGEIAQGLRSARTREGVESKIVWDEMMRLKVMDGLADNAKVTGITVLEFDTAGVANFSYRVPLSGRSH
jgi:hypothetical protein